MPDRQPMFPLGSGPERPPQKPFLGAEEAPITDLMALLRARAAEEPDGIAYTYLSDGEEPSCIFTYGGLDARARAVASGLQMSGAPGDRVLLLFPAGAEFITAFFGCVYAGMVAVPAYLPKQNKHRARLDAILADAGSSLVLTDSPSLALLANQRGDGGALDRALCLASDCLTDSRTWTPPLLKPESLAFLQYTSGSTGKPKGVMVSHGNVLHNLGLMQKAFELGPQSVFVSWLPTFHDMGLVLGMLQPLYGGFHGVLMPPNAFLQKPVRWLQAMSRFGGTATAAPNFAYDLCAEKSSSEDLRALDLSAWRSAVNGAEPVRWATLRRFQDRFADCGFRPEAFIPAYGMAEGTLYISGERGPRPLNPLWVRGEALEGLRAVPASAQDPGAKALVPCGPAFGQRVCIVDPETLQRADPGQIGEIWVKGNSVAQGYWGREEETLQAFGATLNGEGGAFLRTGDLGFLQGEQVVVAGRLKDLIIVRGVNYFPQDLEATLQARSADLRPGCGAAFTIEDGGEEKLVLVQELQRHPAGPLAETAQLVREEVLVQHGLSVWALVLVKTGSIPKTSSGKIQRRACRQAFLDGSLDALYAWSAALATVAERSGPSISSAWDVLLSSLQKLGAPTDGKRSQRLLSLGLDSLQAAELQAGLKSAWGIEIPLARFYEDIDLQALLEGPREAPITTQSPASPLPLQGLRIPMSPLQQSFYLARQSGEPASFVEVELVLPDKDGLGAWQARLNALSARHCSLGLGAEPDLCLSTAAYQAPAALKQVSLPPLDDPAYADARRRVRTELEALASDPAWKSPYAGVLLQSPGAADRLLLLFDHLYVDGLSVKTLLADLGDTGAQGPVPLSFEEGLRQRALSLTADKAAQDRAHWMGRLREAEPWGDLPPGFAGEAGAGSQTFLQPLDAAQFQALEAAARREGVTVFALFGAAFAKLWSFWLRRDRLVLNTSLSGRPAVPGPAWVGCYADILPLVLEQSTSASLCELARSAQAALLEVQTHQAVSGVELARDLAKERAQRPQALSPLTLTSGLFIDWEAGPLPIQEVRIGAPATWLDLAVFRQGAGAVLAWNYDAARIAPARLTRLVRGMARLLDLISRGDQADPFSALLEAEDLALDARLNAAQTPAGEAKDLVSLFRAAAKIRPQAIALSEGERRWTYAQLDQASDKLAWRLKGLGARPGVLVALCLERSAEAVLSILGILKAGAAYLPLDPVYPQARLNFMLEDAQPVALLTQASLAKRFQGLAIPQVTLEGAWGLSQQVPLPPQSSLSPSDPAYVIYTSGSTGAPKGVVIRHAEVARLLSSTQPWFQFGPQDVWTLFHSYAFDFSVWELWGALAYGGRLVVVPAALSRDASAFYDLCRAESVTVLNQTPGAFYAFLAAESGRPAEGLLRTLRFIVFGGEALDLAALRPWYHRHGGDGSTLVNMYGITETTVHVTYRPLQEADALANRGSLIGVPIPDLSLHVLDSALRPVPVGVAGELYVGGAGLAQGYLKRPELTQERFIDSARGRLYRSGDLARFLPDGELDYIGRGDQQVKVRGFRVELGEIAERLRGIAGVQDVAVLALDAGPGDKRLAAYLVPQPGQALPAEAALRASLSQDLPDYMVPAAFVALGSLPLTENGKLDRRALPAPAWGSAQRKVEAADPLEASLLILWSSLLAAPDAGVEDDFFVAGGHSLAAARLLALAGAEHGCRLSLGRFMQAPTLRALAAQVRESAAERPAEVSALEAGPAEQSLWLLQQDQPHSGRLHVAWALWRQGAPDPRALASALEKVVARHAALKTAFVLEHGRLLRQTQPSARAQVDDLGSAESAELARSLAEAWAAQPFDLAKAPLLRCAVVAAEGGHWVAFCAHHIIFDLSSLEQVMYDLAKAWEARSLSPAADGFSRSLSPAEAERLGGAWKELLEGYDPRPPLPAVGPVGRRALRQASVLSGLAWSDIERFAAEQASSPFQVLLCAWQLTLLKAGGRRDLCVGSPVSQRASLAEQDCVGYFANMLPFRLRLLGGESRREALKASRSAAKQALALAELPFASLVGCLKVPRVAGRHPLFQCALIVQGPAPTFEWGGQSSTLVELPNAEAKLDLALVVQGSAAPSLSLEHVEGLLAPGQASALLERFEEELKSLLQASEALWDGTPALTDQAMISPQVSKTVVQLFADRVHADSSLPALRLMDGQELSYAQVAVQVRAVAGCLDSHGILPGDAVGVHCAASPEWVAAALGVLEASAIYVPLDPQYPRERLQRMARAASLKVILTDRPWPAEAGDLSCVDLASACRWSPPLLRAPHEPNSEQPAYLIFTSGSSGEPKGVLVKHGALANHAQAYAQALTLGPGDTVMQFVPISFDASLEEVFPTLCAGACLGLPQASQALGPQEASEALQALEASVAHFPAAYWHAWAPTFDRQTRARLPHLRALVTGGEAPDPGVLKRFLACAQPLDYFNAYGPTEAAITSLLWKLSAGEAVPSSVPLGRPLTGVQLRLVDEEGKASEAGALAELWIGGLGLAQGYWGDPVRTQERFVSLGSGPAQRRYYRSGDLVRRLPDGALCYAGRRDEQVKISGYRVELGDIESSLRSSPGVGDGAARLEGHGPQAQIWAWAVPQPGSELDEEVLRDHMAQTLPLPLLPSRIWVVDALPRTANGKLDRRALRAGAETASTVGVVEEGPLQGLIELWQKNLSRPGLGADSDFFASGGTSLMAVQLAAELGLRTGQRVTLDALYEAPTPRRFQQRLQAGLPSSALTCLRKEYGSYPLLWLHPVGGQVACYRHLTEALAGVGPVYGIQAEEALGQPGLVPDLHALAERYADHLQSAGLQGPWVLAGWSMGGLLACELSHVLKERGISVGLLALIDSVIPDPVQGALLEADEGLCRSAFERDLSAQGLDPAQAEPLYPAFRTLAKALHSFKPRVLNAPLALMLSEATQRGAHRDPLSDWARLAGEGLTFKVLPGDHYSVIKGPAAMAAADFITAQARKAWAWSPELSAKGARS